MLTVITGEAYVPSEAHREMVVILKLNDVSHDRIANAIGVSRLTLEYFYAKELDFGVTAIVAHCTKRMLWLANQNADLGVALKANAMVLQPRVKSWREPSWTWPRRSGIFRTGRWSRSRLTLSDWSDSDELLLRLKRRQRELILTRKSLPDWCRLAGFEPAEHHRLILDALTALVEGRLDRQGWFAQSAS